MRIIKTKDYDAMSAAAARIIASQITLKPDCVLGLATGSSPVGTYQKLIEWNHAGELDFSAVRSVNLDRPDVLPQAPVPAFPPPHQCLSHRPIR